jgi:serine/threonine protein kinase
MAGAPWEQTWRTFGRSLGGGAHGTIARVIERAIQRRHGVLKVLKQNLQGDQKSRQSFLKECNVLARLRLDAVPPLLDSNAGRQDQHTDKELYYVRKFVDGLALDQYILGAKYTADECILFTLRLVDAIESLHRLEPPIFHRDLKPPNIIVRGKLDPVLIDFGAAYSDDGLTSATIDNEPGIIGNAFLRMRGSNDAVPSMDVEHCCGILCYLLTHLPPQHVTTMNNACPHRRFDWVLDASDRDRESISLVLDHGLSLHENDRFHTTSELRDALRPVLDNLETVSPRTILARSSLTEFATEEFLLDRLRFQHFNNELIEVLDRFIDVIQIPEADVGKLTYSEIIERGLHFHSMADGEPLIGDSTYRDIHEFFVRANNAGEDPDALRAALQFFPAISKYVDRRVALHKEATLNAAQHEALKIHQEFLDKMQKELSMQELTANEIEAYQRYIDTINNAFDGEFAVIKHILYPWVWKFGACVFWTAGSQSSHRLFRIPKGSNSLLLMKTDEERFSDWWEHIRNANERPLGDWSDLFVASPLIDSTSTSFLITPEEHGKQLVYNEFKKVIDAEALPLYGELLCTEVVFEYVDRFHKALGLQPSDETNVEFFRACIQSKHGAVDMQAQLLSKCTTQLALSSCDTLLALGRKWITRPYRLCGTVPIDLSKQANMEMLRENVATVFTRSIDEYRSFVSGNGFRRLISPEYLNDDISVVYYINLDNWISCQGICFMQYCHVDNSDRQLQKVEIEFGTALPGPGFTITVKGRKYKASSMIQVCSLKIFSRRPMRDCVYEMFRTDAERSYDPRRANDYTRPYLVPRLSEGQ